MERILTLNIGASRIALAEFGLHGAGAPELLRYDFASLPEGIDGAENFGLAVGQALREVASRLRIAPGPIMVSLPGQSAFPRFVKLLKNSQEQFDQLIKYEAEQNVPFPIDELVWDYELIGNDDMGEQSVMIVAVKAETVNAITQAITMLGFEPEIIDIAPITLYNAVRFNYPDRPGCTLVIDIGARATNLVFVEEDKAFCRTIQVAGSAITQEIAKSFQIPLEEAEEYKCNQGFVAQGGVYEVEDPTLDKMSKVIRNVMTRLHAEISRSINFYRSQQGGSTPTSILITGGSARLPYIVDFFQEKLKVEVGFLNPFESIALGRNISPEEAGRDGFSLAESVGLALRKALKCPIELNLISGDTKKRRQFKKKIPFFIVTAVAIALSILTWIFYIGRMSGLYVDQQELVESKLNEMSFLENQVTQAKRDFETAQAKADALKGILLAHGSNVALMRAVRSATFERGMWITGFEMIKNPQGNNVGVRIQARMWSDEAKARQGNATIAEQFVQRLRRNEAIFAQGEKDIRITSASEPKDWLRSFTVEARFFNSPIADESKANRSARR